MIRLRLAKQCVLAALALFILGIPGKSASYVPKEGRISKKVGLLLASPIRTNVPVPTSYGLILGGVGDFDEKGALLLDVSVLKQRFFGAQGDMQATLDALGFDLGYRRLLFDDLWGALQLGSIYPWNVTLGPADLTSGDPGNSKFRSLLSIVFGLQREAQSGPSAVLYSARLRKYINLPYPNDIEVDLSFAIRFGL